MIARSALTSLGHPDGAVSGADSVQISVRPDTHGGHGRLARLFAHLYGPLHLLNVLKVLEQEMSAKRNVSGRFGTRQTRFSEPHQKFRTLHLFKSHFQQI